MAPSHPSSVYPSPPSLSPVEGPLQSYWDRAVMVSNASNNADGVGALNNQRAIDIARNTEGDLDPGVRDYLEKALHDIWTRIQQQPDSYILSKDEFPVFNYYIQRFHDNPVAEQAVDRYWRHAHEPTVSRS